MSAPTIAQLQGQRVEPEPALEPTAKPVPKLMKDDTVALWHAISWMEASLWNWRKGGFADDTDRAQYDHQRELLLQAKRALRKANAIRKQAIAVPQPNSPSASDGWDWASAVNLARNALLHGSTLTPKGCRLLAHAVLGADQDRSARLKMDGERGL